jgi:hypothetical protein
MFGNPSNVRLDACCTQFGAAFLQAVDDEGTSLE